MNPKLLKFALIIDIVVAVAILVSLGWFVASKYFSLQSQIDQIVTFLNTQIQRSQTTTPAIK